MPEWQWLSGHVCGGGNQSLHCRHYCVGQQHEKMQQTDSFTMHHFDGFSLSEKQPIK